MRVLVVGSVRCTQDPKVQQAIRQAGHELGKSLAERGHTILVGSEAPEDVDPDVVAGAAASGRPAQVEVHLTQGAAECYSQGPIVVTNRRHRYSDWDITVLEVLRNDADAVIAIGGRVGVVQTGITAWMLGRPVLPIASFDGGARTVWGYGSGERNGFYFGALTDAQVDSLTNSWSGGGNAPTATAAIDALELLAKAAARAKTPKLVFVAVSLATLITLMLWVGLLSLPLLGKLGWLFQCPSCNDEALAGPRFVLFLISVCAAGALGSLMQTLRGVRDDRPTTLQHVVINGVLGVAAGFLTAALYLIAQIAITGTLVLPAKDVDYARIALVCGLGSLFSSLYLDAALARFDQLKDSVISGKYGLDAKDGPKAKTPSP